MTPEDFKAARREAGLSTYAWGYALGLVGNRNTIGVAVRRMEKGEQDIRGTMIRLIKMFQRFGIPAEFLPDDENEEGQD